VTKVFQSIQAPTQKYNLQMSFTRELLFQDSAVE